MEATVLALCSLSIDITLQTCSLYRIEWRTFRKRRCAHADNKLHRIDASLKQLALHEGADRRLDHHGRPAEIRTTSAKNAYEMPLRRMPNSKCAQ